jgi:iron(II)-dependent oxidoreductase
MMGSEQGDEDEKPVHGVKLNAFYLDSHEVTNAQYRQFAEATGHRLPPFWKPELDRPDEPVVGVSWHDAAAYAAWAGKRLPTEAEWEYAARGSSETKADRAQDNIKSFGLLPVGSLKPNAYGLYDMTGNVWEWCADWYGNDFYEVSPAGNPTGPVSGTLKVLRGGAWYCDRQEARPENRFYAAPGATSFNNGFRCARDAH